VDMQRPERPAGAAAATDALVRAPVVPSAFVSALLMHCTTGGTFRGCECVFRHQQAGAHLRSSCPHRSFGVMPPKPPVVLAKKGPSNSDHHHHSNNHHHHHAHGAKQQQQQQPKNTARLKLQVRRLPPALTKDEFLLALGGEWKVPSDKIDWLDYRCGKMGTPGKMPQQSRAYLHLTNEQHIKPFEALFLQLSFHDAKASYKDPQLKHLLPALAFAPNQRVPSAKQRQDGRQGTIDQDLEFIAFLERETQPVTKPLSLDQALAQEKPKEKVSSTPLLDDLREKKQNKARANQKHKEDKSSQPRGREQKAEAKQPVKLLAKDKKNQPAASASAPASVATPARRRERAAPNTIKSMLQRDLGLNAPSKRGAKNASPATDNKTVASPATAVEPASTAASPPAKQGKPRSGRNKDKATPQTTAQENSKPPTPAPAPTPAPTGILKKPAQQPTPKPPKAARGNNNAAAASAPATTTSTPAPTPSTKQSRQSSANNHTSATKAYLKHANASQGVTEALLQTALSAFGPLVKVEIDKRKGTALAEFKDNQGLKAAMAKKTVPVAQGAVEVLEFRDKQQTQGGGGRNPPANPRGAGGACGNAPGRGRGGRVRGGGAASAAGTATNSNGHATAPSNGKPDAT
jgi:regulator of nonsense transcripts 3